MYHFLFNVNSDIIQFKDMHFEESEPSVTTRDIKFYRSLFESQEKCQQTMIVIKNEIKTLRQMMLYHEEARFHEMKFQVQNTLSFIESQKLKHAQVFAADLARKIFTKGFIWFQDGKFTQKKLKQFFCNNFLYNILNYCHVNKLNHQNLYYLDKHLKTEVFSYLKKRYPQNEGEPNRKFQNMIMEVDNLDSNQNDLIFKSQIKFQYRKDGDYSSQIMKFINYILNITREENKDNDSLFNVFYKQMERVFQSVGSQDWMMKVKEKNFQELFRQQELQQLKFAHILTLKQQHNLIKNQKSSPQLHASYIIHMSTAKDSHNTDAPRPNSPRSYPFQPIQIPPAEAVSPQLSDYQKKQKYKKKVQQYTKYLISQKISNNAPLFSKKDISQKNMKVSNPGIMRILGKWCQQLQKCFEQIHINSRDQRFRMQDGTQRYIKSNQRQDLFLQLENQNLKVKQFLKKVKSNIYQNQEKILNGSKCFTAFRNFCSQEQGAVGYFSAAMRASYQNYIISYLNKLIHCILEAQEKMKASYSKKEHYKMATNLISFKVGDLLRCKCSSKQAQIIAIYQYIRQYCKRYKDKLELVRVKNRLSEGTKDILINFRFHQKLLVQMQLSIDEESSNFIKCSDKANHFIYQLERATFGPISQLCNVYFNVDPRAEHFKQKFQQKNLSIIQSHYSPQCPNSIYPSKTHQFAQLSLPIHCSCCNKFTSSLNIIQNHQKCSKCGYNRCAACRYRRRQFSQYPSSNGNMQVQMSMLKSKRKIILKYADFAIKDKRLVKKKISLIDLEKKGINQRELYLVYFNFKIMVFEDIGQWKVKFIDQLKNQKEFDKFFANKEVNQLNGVTSQQQKKLIGSIHKQVLKLIIRNAIVKLRKYFVFQGIQQDQNIFEGENKMEAVQQINLSNGKMKSIKPLLTIFPNAKIVLLHKNKISDITEVSKWRQIEQLNFQGNQIQKIPEQIKQLKMLKFLLLTKNKFIQFPIQICYIQNLRTLNFKQNNLITIPPQIKHLRNLQHLRLTSNKIAVIPPQIGHLPCLEELDISINSLKSVPAFVGNLTKIQKLYMYQNLIQKFQNNAIFSLLENLQQINFSNNKIKEIPSSIKDKKNLKKVNFQKNELTFINQQVFNLPALEQLLMQNNQIQNLYISENATSKKLKVVNLLNNKIKQLPRQFFQFQTIQKLKIGNKFLTVPLKQDFLRLSNIKSLSMQNMSLKQFPKIVFQFPLLESLSLDHNNLSSIPSVDQFSLISNNNYKKYCKWHQIRELYLSYNAFTQIPSQILQLKHLQNLGLAYNNIRYIPAQISSLQKLQKIHLSGNQIPHLIYQLVSLPNLKQILAQDRNLTPNQMATLGLFTQPKQMHSIRAKNKILRIVKNSEKSSKGVSMAQKSLSLKDSQGEMKETFFSHTKNFSFFQENLQCQFPDGKDRLQEFKI